MQAVTIRGASDDLIEVEGDINEEFNHYGSCDDNAEPRYLAFGDGTVLSITYGVGGGFWRINRVRAGSAVYEKQEATDENSDDYSDRVTLTGELGCVVFGTQYVKARS
ncbi:hypothetical protein K8I61_00865 [bacterium]|nr:hypothetical protein [bacterium]